ncbi:Nucleolar protein 11-like [Takifugu flavidus]|uniref:Nucleolar protein 11-like n=1 Tax=Takifugu flavidus TaxID=433684 RepID=A0A5C6MWY6_9TELE|nr:Nucleolar protein 11-like [Takifugu flavidus]
MERNLFLLTLVVGFITDGSGQDNAKRCPYPESLLNGEVYYTDTVYGSTINYTCDEGYTMNGADVSECLSNGMWSNPAPECKAVQCGLAPIPQFGKIIYNKHVEGNTTSYGTQGTYQCLPPYVLFGDAKAECTSNGNWTKTPECRVVSCPPPENIERGYMSSNAKRTYDYTETIKYGCHGDHVIEGSQQIVCQKYGNWSERPSCKGQSLSDSGIQGIEVERDNDHVIVTDSSRSVTLYMVSDQKPLSTWTVKQGQTFTCPAVYNSQTKEYVAVSDSKVIRIWKEEDMLLDKVFKSTVSSDIWSIHSIPGGEPVVLFKKGAMRLLDSLLTAPQQPIEEVISQEETIWWSTNLMAESQQFVIFTTEQKGNHFLYLQRLNPNTLQRYQLEREEPVLSPLSFCASYRDKHICLLYLYPNGHLYQSTLSVRNLGGVSEEAQALPLSRSLLLSLPVGEGPLKAASALILDEAHVAVVGVPHPSAGAGKDFLCIWNTNFQTLQAGKEMAGQIYGQRATRKTQSTPCLTVEKVLELIKTAPLEEVQKEVEELLSHADSQDLQFSVGHLASALVSRSLANPSFYTSDILVQLVRTQFLCHSVCPDLLLLALERKDYFLCQLCLQFFPDIPEAMTCACLKAFISMPDADAEKVTLEPDSISFMEALIAREHGEASVQNGFSSSDDKDCSDALEGDGKARISAASEGICPVKLVSELGKIEASFQELDKMKVKRDVAQYSIEIIELL